MGGAMSRLRTTVGGQKGVALRRLGERSLLVATAIALGAAGCGGSTQQRQPTTMMLSAQHPQNPGEPGGAGGAGGAPGDVTGMSGLADGSGDAAAGKVIDAYTYRLAPGDLIDVKFPYHPEENERVPVRPDGRIGLQVIGDVQAAGLTVKELEGIIVEKSSLTLRDPVVSVVIAQLAEHKVYVGGQVAKPGFVTFRDGMTPLQAIVERGGFVDDANTDDVLYIRRVGGQVQSQRLDLDSVMDGESVEQIVMSPDDIIIVPRTFIGEADVWVDQWIRGLLPTVPRPGFDLNTLAF
jgi:protein involved in polysaccharide export with SLBB domain